MADLLKNLLASAITLGLSDKDAFVNRIAGVITEYQTDPEKANEWAKAITHYLEEFKDDVRLQRIISNAGITGTAATKEDFEKLTAALNELTKQLQHKNT